MPSNTQQTLLAHNTDSMVACCFSRFKLQLSILYIEGGGRSAEQQSSLSIALDDVRSSMSGHVALNIVHIRLLVSRRICNRDNAQKVSLHLHSTPKNTIQTLVSKN